jgi:hypothetical protein
LNDTVSFPASAPAAINIKVQGSADGDPLTGRGAIVFDRAASPATFVQVGGGTSDLILHQTATVPATGSATVRFAYASALTSTDVGSLTQTAINRFGGASPAPSPPAPPAATGKRAAALKKCKKKKSKKARKKCKKKARRLPV